ncbi:avirulence protein [Marinomonas mediterranea]|uniref:YopJ family acetyltransferase n=1 Tax=Marinomonas mediterranea TaxID=119864 RepID=UPI00234A4D23|nr:YopJ family acetyltransferase [Marinomonas mediterranea]WCN14030.1 avirulence protein [Marinomonas mediterranea]
MHINGFKLSLPDIFQGQASLSNTKKEKKPEQEGGVQPQPELSSKPAKANLPTPSLTQRLKEYACGSSSVTLHDKKDSSKALPDSQLVRQSALSRDRVYLMALPALKQIDKDSRSDPLPEKAPIVPSRLQNKIDQLNLLDTKSLDSDLHDYAQHAISCIKTGESGGYEMNKFDKKLLPLIAEAENKRTLGLNLHVFKSTQECTDALHQMEAKTNLTRKPNHVRIVYPPASGVSPNHHAALDVKFTPKNPPSIVGFEPATFENSVMLEHSLRYSMPHAKLNVVNPDIQKSDWDCAMFSLNHALKAHKHEDGYVYELHQGEKGLPIPADFMKHAHAKSSIQSRLDKGCVVSKDKEGIQSETLEHRNLAYRTERGERAFSASIEGFRLQEIQRAALYVASQKL